MTTDFSFKSRFSPSPTGLIHLGNLRTALFNALLARAHRDKGESASFLLRIEDTDLARSQNEFIENLIYDLRWLGLQWDEGPGCQGPHDADYYYQSKRVAIYEKYYQQLRDQSQAYWCFCTDTELTIARKSQINAGIAPRYPGTCRHLTLEQQTAKREKGIIPALRFRVPDDEIVQFEDFIQGPKVFAANDIGDFIIQKADQSASFMFCNAVDDALMSVTHVMRGEDHLTNTPRQLLILKALGLSAPSYGHTPLILGFDGKPLSKRNGSQSVQSLREQGYFPVAIVNYLSRLGHHFDSENLLSLEALGQCFSVAHIGRAPARFDVIQLKHWQKEAMLKESNEALWEWMKDELDWIPEEKSLLFVETVKQNIVLKEEALFWAKQLFTEAFDKEEDALKSIEEAGKEMLTALENAINQAGDDYTQVVAHVKSTTNKKGKALFLPIRSIITGQTHGPELAKIFLLMGKANLLKRVRTIRGSE